MDEIIELYLEELERYLEIKSILIELKDERVAHPSYEAKLKDVDHILNIIELINNRIEQLKQIYILKKNIDDFKGELIKPLETAEAYNSLKRVVDKITEEIKSIKRLQDQVINKINSDAEGAWNNLREFNICKDGFDKYCSNRKYKVSSLLDVKK